MTKAGALEFTDPKQKTPPLF